MWDYNPEMWDYNSEKWDIEVRNVRYISQNCEIII